MKKSIMTIATFLVANKMSQEDFDGQTPVLQLKAFNEISKNNAEFIEELEKNSASKEDIDAAIKAKDDEYKTQHKAVIKTLGIMSERLEKMNSGGSAPKTATIKSIVGENFKEISALKANTDDEFEIKADVTTASIANNTGSFRDETLSPLNTPFLTMENLFPHLTLTGKKGNVKKTYTYMDWDAATVVRAAKMIAECGLYDQSTVAWIEKNIPIRKVGDSIPVCEEFFEDEDNFAVELEFFLRDSVAIEVNDQIVNGDGTGENLTGLVASSTPYVPVASGITDASTYDLLVKVRASITALGKKFMPNFAVMNNTDICKMKLKKDGNNNYVMPPFADKDGNIVDGMTIIEDNAIAANTLVVGDRRFGRIIDRVGVTVSRGYVNDQYLKDQTTLKIRRRLAFLIKDSDKTGFAHVTDIATALITLAS